MNQFPELKFKLFETLALIFKMQFVTANFFFSALTVLVRQQEGHPACKKLLLVCCRDDLIRALHVLQLQLSPPPPSSSAEIKSRIETFW